MKLVYLAAPYSGPDLQTIGNNVNRARKYALQLAERRIAFISPTNMTAHFELLLGRLRDPGYEWWLEMTIELLKRSDAVLAIPGWQESNGARREVQYAREHGMPVFEDLAELEEWHRR
jgi:hypothetical protein